MPVWKLEDGLPLGKVGKPYSYLGKTRVAFFIPGLEEILVPGEFIFIEWAGKPVPYLIEDITWPEENTAIIKFEDVDTDELADKLRNRSILIPKSIIPAELLEDPEAGFELEGYTVEDMEGEYVGNVTDIIENGPQNLLVLVNHGREILIPMHEDLIKSVDPELKLIKVDLPDGLIDLY